MPWIADDPRVEVAHYPDSKLLLALNNTTEPIRTRVHGAAGNHWTVDLEAVGHRWVPTGTAEQPSDIDLPKTNRNQ